MGVVQKSPIVTVDELLSFRSRLVRDLAWAMTIPPLVEPLWPPPPLPPIDGESDHDKVQIVSDRRYWLEPTFYVDGWNRMYRTLRALDGDDTPLQRYFNGTEGMRHGLRYERFLRFWFDHDPAIDVVCADHQITDEKRGTTKGQIDFVIDYQGTRIQLEVAVKFFLRVSPPGEEGAQRRHQIENLVGTDLKDRMYRKVAHMLFHQRTVRSRECGRIDRSVLSLRGFVYPKLSHSSGESQGWPVRWWQDETSLVATARRKPSLQWNVGDSRVWFSPVSRDEVEWASLEEVLEQIRTSRIYGQPSSALIIGGTETGEVTRGFILFDR